jgi:hypothetical protein
VESFPATPQFYVYAVLTNAVGHATIKVIIESLDSGEVLFSRSAPAHFDNKLSTMQVSLRVADCTFDSPGWYQVTLLVDEEWVAQRRLRVY